MRRSFVRSVVSATISSVVVVSVARIYVARICVARIYVARIYFVRVYVVARRFSSVVVVSVARIYVARICVVRIYVAQIYVAWVYVVARRFCRCSLIDGRFEVKVWTKSRRHSRRRERRAYSWCVETARCCEVRGSHLSRNCISPTCISSMRRSCIPSRSAVPHDIVHVGIGLFGGQLYLSHTLGEVFKLSLPALDYDVQSLAVTMLGGVELSIRGVSSLKTISSPSLSLSACESWNVSTSLILNYYLIR